MAKKTSGGGLGLLFLVLLFGGIGFGVFSLFGSNELANTERDMLRDAVKNARSDKPLSPKDEALLRIHLALQDYKLKNGRPPDQLSQLIPVYFDVVPKNPDTGKPFEFTRTGLTYSLVSGDEPTQVASVVPTDEEGQEIAINMDVIPEGLFINPNEMQEEDYVYDPAGRRDPFRPFDFSGKRREFDASVPPLERYSLAQLRVTAILRDPEGNFKALVEDAEGRGYSVSEGARIGDQNGTVVSISPKSIKVLERVVDFAGKSSEKVTEMKLPVRED